MASQQSLCPTCLAQVDHEAGVTEVECSCGAKFDPSQQFDELPSLEEAMANPRPKPSAPAAPLSEETPSELPESLDDLSTAPADAPPPALTDLNDATGEPSAEDSFGPLGDSPSEPEVGEMGFGVGTVEGTGSVEPGADFAESDQAFEEIREFGESVLPGQQDPPAKPLGEKEPEKSPPSAAPTPSKEPAGTMRMTSGALLQGFAIAEYFTPVSLQCAVDEEAEEPLKPAFDRLWEKARAQGGNAVIDLKWKLSADGKKVLISGTPVKCGKAG